MISIVMPVLNIHPLMERMTKEALDSLTKYTYHPYEITVVLHGGPQFKTIAETIYHKERLSIAQAYNLGFAKAKGKYYCCLHNDVIMSPGWEFPLMYEVDRGNIAFPLVDESQGLYEERGINERAKWLPPSCCFMISASLFKQLNGYDEQFEECHFEDTDLWYRAIQKGAKLIECTLSNIIHYRGGTRAFFPDKGQEACETNRKKYTNKWDGEYNLPELEGKNA